ncbi:MAG: glutamate racemase [Candidatus Omnitrophica bacterium]|nr:glutamate racemase [Candidatus Omnitrophota bacterium]
MSKEGPIGVFDSGLGGLTVVKALIRHLPSEDVVYFGDTARVPYGTKSPESIIRFSKENAQVLLKHRVKMIVVACNSSSSYALPLLKKSFDLPILGVIAPGVRKAVATTKNKVVGIIATPATINSRSYHQEIAQQDSSIRIISQACPLFVPLVEEGWFHKPVTLSVAEEYLRVIQKSKADTLILGCTHYPLLKATLQKVMGQGVELIDSAREVALEVKKVLEEYGLARGGSHRAKYKFLISDEPAHFQRLAKRFLGYDIKDVKKVLVK